MRFRRSFPIGLAAVLALASWGCASKLKRDLTDKAPHGASLEAELDLSLVDFVDARSGAAVNLGAYMQASGLDFALLTFGSKRCGACNLKSQHLTDHVIGQHPLFLTDPGRRFEIVGVNTDSEPGGYERFPYIKWKDPAGLEMLAHFMPAGKAFAVPLTVMLTRGGIAWRVLPSESVSMETMLARVEATLGLGGDAHPSPGGGSDGDGDGGDDGGDGDDGDGDGGGDGGGTGPQAAALAEEAPGRLKDVRVDGCAGRGAGTSLDAALGAAPVRFVAVHRGACGDDCKANLAALAAVKASCGAGCAVAALATEAPDAAACASGIVWRGGGEFFDVFRTHFDWRYTPVEQPDTRIVLPPVAGPLVLGFAESGRLVYSHEGRLARRALVDAMAAPGFGEVARGPDFPLWDKARGEFKLADVRRRARYTVIAAWGAYPQQCESCIAELQHWSKPGELVDFCAARPADCQVLAMETHLPDDGRTMAQFYDGLVNGDGAGFAGLAPQGIRVPLVLDPVPADDWLRRFFDGYMTAYEPEWWFEYRTLVYDREGKVVAAFKAEAPGGEEPVLKLLKARLGNGG